MEEVRTVQITGGSTFTVSLPKDWAQRCGITKGSRVVMSERDDGSISIFPLGKRPLDQRVKEIELGHDMSLVTRKVIASYVMGFDTIVLKASNIDSEQRARVFQLVQGLLGLEVVREDSQSIEMREMLDPTQLTVPSALTRLSVLAESMMSDLPRALEEGDTNILSDIMTREPHVDTIHWFIVRQINNGIADHRYSKSIDLDLRLATSYLSVSRNIERVCDHVENVARLALDFTRRSATPRSVIDLSKHCAEIFSSSVRSFIRSDLAIAEEVLAEVDHYREEYAMSTFQDVSRGRRRSNALRAMLATESLHRIISYSQDIAEITLDSITSK